MAAIAEQAATLGGTSNLFYSEPAMLLTERLVESSLGGRAFLCNSGAEANECAIKLVRRRAHGRGVDRPEIVVLDHAFHGRTLAALAATPRLAREDLFGPLPAGFVPVPRDDPAALDAAVGPSTAAVMLEPIQGESGVHPIADEVLVAARAACDRVGALLVFDEIQTGMGRTGTLWAHAGDPRPARRDDEREGARRRPAGRRLRHRARRRRGPDARGARLDVRRRSDLRPSRPRRTRRSSATPPCSPTSASGRSSSAPASRTIPPWPGSAGAG